MQIDWNRTGSPEDYVWPEKKGKWLKLQQSLHALLGPLPNDLLSVDTTSAERNRALRAFVSPRMRNASLGLCSWIVKDWGGVTSHRYFDTMVSEFGNFSEDAIDEAITARKFSGISSWSKLVAFAHPERYAIYDSRTAGALNCLLPSDAQRFFVPQAKGLKKTALRRKRHVSAGQSGSYFDFLRILGYGQRPGWSLLDVEMALFANSDVICESM